MKNRYPGSCCLCGGHVPKWQGIYQDRKVYHAEGECQTKKHDWSNVIPDEYQQAVIDSIQLGLDGPHVLTDAKAGSGKTTIGCLGLTKLHELDGSLSLGALAFGNEDGKRLREVLPQKIEARTHHSLCMEIVKKAYNKKLNQFKVNELLDAVVGEDVSQYGVLREYVKQLLSLVQADAIEVGDEEGIWATLNSESHDVGIPKDMENKVVGLTKEMLERSMDIKKHGFSFDDALYLCATKDLPLPQYDVVLVDEIQDWNNCQLEILKKMIDNGTRVIAIGDPNQSLYGFRGANPQAFNTVQAILSDDFRGLEELPIPVCRRSGKLIVEHASRIIPGIKSLPDAADGEIKLEVPIEQMLNQFEPGKDMVLCRVNSRLVQLMYACIKFNIPAYILKGQQEAGMLCWMVDLLARKQYPPTDDVGELINRANEWLESRSNSFKAEEHRQRVEVLTLISERVYSVDDLKNEIKKIFSPPKKGQKAIVLSTIHRAKGSEAERVWNISPDLLPHPKATTQAQIEQEKFAHYVAITRAKSAYYETTGDLVEALRNMALERENAA